MSVAIIRNTIKSTFEGISSLSGITIHDYKRRVNEWSDIETEFKTNNMLHTWIITYDGSTYDFDTTTEGYKANRKYTVWGLYGLNDSNSTEKTFDTITNNVENEFANLRVVGSGRNRLSGLTTTMDEFMFAGILCNRCLLTIEVEENQSYA
jgi:hypothetical protein